MKQLLLLLIGINLFYIGTISAQKKKSAAAIKIAKVWARPAAERTNSAMYFIIQNTGSKTDTLLEAESKIADLVQIHETFKRDNDRMGMRELQYVVVPPKSNVAFKPGGMHVMLIDTQQDLKIGSSFEAVLKFRYAGKIKIRARVQDISAGE